MSVVTVQLGQCGNQVGHELFDIICSDVHEPQRKEYRSASCERFFHHTAHGGRTPPLDSMRVFPLCLCCIPVHRFTCRVFHYPDLEARAVLVDMESKVINRSMSKAAKSGRWRYGESSHFSQKQGSGNNWANG